jgi:hypothetical protein
MRRSWLVVLGILVACTATACGSSSSASRTATPTTVDAAPQPAGNTPSESARMICAKGAQAELAGVLGRKATHITDPTWSNHVYSCDYVYPQGTVTLSVKELDDKAGTTSYFDTLGTLLGRLPDDVPIAQGAFQTPNGSMVVRKDFKVLFVDVGHLPDGLNQPGLTAPDVASAMALTLLHCWQG